MRCDIRLASFLAFASLLLAFVPPPPARAQAAAPVKVTSVEGITEYRLANGMRVLLFPDPTRPMVTVNLTLFVGSRHEGYGEGGMAHLLEHMLFKSTPSTPDIKKALVDRGAQWNGTTWLDRTNYFETLPATDENLEFAIRLEADRMMNCNIKPEELSSEFTVVRNEFERGENSPGRVLSQRMAAVAYEWHNYGKSTIGNRADIERVPVESLRRFYKKYYQPDNAMLILAGKFDEQKALSLAAKHFGPIPRPERKLEPTYTEEPPQDGERVVTLRRVGETGIVGLMYHVPAGPHEEFVACDALQEILTTAVSGELYKALVDAGKASSVGGTTFALHDPGFMQLFAELRKGQSHDEVRRIMLETIERVARDGVPAEQVDRYKKRFAAQRKRAMVDTAAVAREMSEWAAQGDWRLYFLMRDRVERLTPQAVQEAAKRYLTASNRTVGLYYPTDRPERTPVPPPPDLAELLKDYKGREAVAAGEQLDPDPMKIEARIERPAAIDGVKVAVLRKKTRQEMVLVRLTLRYGNEENLKGKRELAEITPTLMRRATRSLNKQQLADALDENEATLGVGGGLGTLTVSLQAPRKNLPAALDLMRQVLREPAFPAEELEVIKRQQLAGLESARTEPDSLASNALTRKLRPYAKDDVRYAPTFDEQIADVGAVTPEQVKAFYEGYLGSAAGELVVVGDADVEPTLKALSAMLAGWKAPMPYARIVNAIPGGIAGSVETIETPDKANAVLAAGMYVALRDDAADYPAAVIANRIIGGSATSRLWMRLREKEGYSYGAGSGVSASPFEPYGQFTARAICNPANAEKARVAAVEEIARFLEGGTTPDELQKAKDAYLQGRMLSRTQEPALATMIGSHLYADRTFAYDAKLEDAVRALTPEQVLAAAKKYVDPAKLVMVLAGDFAKGAGAAKP